jgi:hypothetical protein
MAAKNIAIIVKNILFIYPPVFIDILINFFQMIDFFMGHSQKINSIIYNYKFYR